MTERQFGKLLAAAYEEPIDGDGECVKPLLDQVRECRMAVKRCACWARGS